MWGGGGAYSRCARQRKDATRPINVRNEITIKNNFFLYRKELSQRLSASLALSFSHSIYLFLAGESFAVCDPVLFFFFYFFFCDLSCNEVF